MHDQHHYICLLQIYGKGNHDKLHLLWWLNTYTFFREKICLEHHVSDRWKHNQIIPIITNSKSRQKSHYNNKMWAIQSNLCTIDNIMMLHCLVHDITQDIESVWQYLIDVRSTSIGQEARPKITLRKNTAIKTVSSMVIYTAAHTRLSSSSFSSSNSPIISLP